MEIYQLLGLSLGGSSFIGLLTYILYQVCNNKCASHLQINGKSISIDVKDVLDKVETPIEKEQIKKEIEDRIKSTLHKVKSRLDNKLENIRV